MIDWWTGTAGVLVGAVIGSLIGSAIPLWWAQRLRRIERRGEIDAMLAEAFRVSLNLRELIGTTHLQPMPRFRLPIGLTEQALPKLVGDQVLDPNELYALVEYVNRIDELNKGLDRAEDAAAQSSPQIASLHGRNVTAADAILNEKLQRHANEPLWVAVSQALLRLQDQREPGWVWSLASKEPPPARRAAPAA
jgi:hypothetical protein